MKSVNDPKICFVLAVVIFVSLADISLAATASFQGLGDLSGGGFYSTAYDISSDGSVVVGKSISSLSSPMYEAFRWTQADNNMVGLGDLTGGSFDSEAQGVSSDGSVIVGKGTSASSNEAFRWTSGGGMVGLGDLPGDGFDSRAYGVSSDSLVIVGRATQSLGFEAFRRTSGGGMVGLGDLPGGNYYSCAYAVSSDGSVVVGTSSSAAASGNNEAFRWTQADNNMVGLGDLAGGSFYSSATDVSSDGLVVVGWSNSTLGREAFRWEANVMTGLGDLDYGSFYSEAHCISSDGSIVLGTSSSGAGSEAFIWDATNGMRSLRDVLVNDCGLDLTSWKLIAAYSISDNGHIVGVGTNPSGDSEAWIATIPEPITIVLLGFGSLLLSRNRRFNSSGQSTTKNENNHEPLIGRV